jgi:hypothetical protein
MKKPILFKILARELESQEVVLDVISKLFENVFDFSCFGSVFECDGNRQPRRNRKEKSTESARERRENAKMDGQEEDIMELRGRHTIWR